jgi:hypothetical protein
VQNCQVVPGDHILSKCQQRFSVLLYVETQTIVARKGKQAIFDNDFVTELCIQFKQSGDLVTYRKICEASNNLMDSIIRSSKFHLQAPFDDIKNYLFLQLENWIAKWSPEKGKVYSYWSTCIKHAAISYVSKESLFRQRFMFTDLPMEVVSNAKYTPNFSTELRQVLIDSLKDLEIRWREPVIQKVIRYMVCCVVNNRMERRQEILRTTILGFPIELPTAKFLLDWTQAAVRAALLEHYDQPLGEIDIIRASERFSFLPDIINLVGLLSAKKLMAVFAGTTIRFPSQTQLRRQTMLKKVYKSLSEDPSPDNVSGLAREFRTTPEKVEAFNELLHENIQAGLVDNVSLYSESAADASEMVTNLFENTVTATTEEDDD